MRLWTKPPERDRRVRLPRLVGQGCAGRLSRRADLGRASLATRPCGSLREGCNPLAEPAFPSQRGPGRVRPVAKTDGERTMAHTALKAGLAAVLMLSSAPVALAQSYGAP